MTDRLTVRDCLIPAAATGALLLIVIVGAMLLASEHDRLPIDTRIAKTIVAKPSRTETTFSPMLVGKVFVNIPTITTHRYLIAADGTIANAGERVWRNAKPGDRIKAHWRDPR